MKSSFGEASTMIKRMMAAPALIRELKAELWAGPRVTNPSRFRSTLLKLVLVRVSVLSTLIGISAFAFFRTKSIPFSGLFYTAVGAVFAVSLLNILAIQKAKNLVRLGYLQLATDVLLSSLAIYVTGSGLIIFLYLLVIMGAAIIFGGHGSVLVAAFAGLCYAILTSGLLPEFGEQHLSPSTVDIFVVYLSLVAVALLSSYLTRQLELLGSIADEHAKNFDALAKQQQQLFDDINEGIITVDLNSVITSINQAGRAIIRLSNLDAEHFVGHSLPTLLERYGVNGIEELLVEQSGAESEVTLKHSRTGEEIALAYSVRPLTDAEGNVSGKMLIFNDVSHVRSMQEMLHAHERMAQLLSQTGEKINQSSFGCQVSKIQMIGESPVMRQVFALVDRIAASEASVLVYGESGTGKELIAKAVHARGPRRSAPFVAINCGAIPENLIESELFGHKKGSFTGAVADNPGLFRQAAKGTIFLDEIGELPLHLQTKLLRVLQDHKIRAVGDVKDQEIDVRVIAATNKDLRKEIAAGKFREDLYYRLNVVSIMVPPLRDRREDIPLLVRYFIGQLCDEDTPLPQISPEAAQLLMNYQFPGNVRELENIIERALVLGGPAILPEHLPPEIASLPIARRPAPHQSIQEQQPIPSTVHLPVDLEGELSRIEKDYLIKALEQANGVKKAAAELLGLNFRSFRYRLKKYGFSDGSEAGQS